MLLARCNFCTRTHLGNLVPGKNEHGIFRINVKTPKSVYLLILNNFFKKWLPRANHCAYETRIEILCKTPVSILRDLPPGVQNHRKTSKLLYSITVFSIPYCRNPSYGPYGPFWFSANFGWDMEKPYQKT